VLGVRRARDHFLWCRCTRQVNPSVLQWAADQGPILVTHDVSTLAKHAFDRMVAGQPMPGVFEVKSDAPVGQAIDDLVLLVECSVDGEWDGQVRFLPL
jgi:hypothetical protein